MYTFLLSILLYPYPYQQEAFFVTFLVLLPFGLLAYGIYRLVIWKMNIRGKKRVNTFLIIAGISLAVLFYAEVAVTLITIHHINKQLGFSYATPETPEGEFFVIRKVIAGKTMDKAGLKPDDRVQMFAVNDLYILLIDNQGKVASFPILRNQEEMMILVSVPELDLPLLRVSFLF